MLVNNNHESYDCVVCLSEVSVPCKLSCGHLIDFQCIGHWLKQGHDDCPLDRKKIEIIEPQNLDPSNTVSVEFSGKNYQIKFFATLNTTLRAVSDVFSAYNEIMYRTEGKFSPDTIIEIEGLDIQNISSGYYHGYFNLKEEKSLKDIPLIPGESYKVRMHHLIKV